MKLNEELEGDLRSLREIREDVREATEAVRRDPTERMARYALAAHLHRLYSCLEDAAYRVSVNINGEVPSGASGHKDLLERTAMEVPGKRRALWAKAPVKDLDDLRKFRHFFRHSYGAEIDREKILPVAEVALRVSPLVEEDIRAFIDGR